MATPAIVTLKKRHEFLRLNGKGKCVTRSTIVVSDATPEASAAPSLVRVGYTATKKLGNAVTRNRIKRRLRAAFREAVLSQESGRDYVLIARQEALQCEYTALVKDLRYAISKLQRESKSGNT